MSAKLSHTFVKSVCEPRRYYDRDGLYLQVRESARGEGSVRKTWVQRVTVDGRRRHVGLGRFPDVSLADARKKAADNLLLAHAGIDPVLHARRALAPTFAEAVVQEIERRRSGWRTEGRGKKMGKTAQSWYGTMRDYVLPHLGHLAVNQITTAHVLKVLDPIWNEKRDTAIKVMRRIGAVMDTAIVQEYREDNPVNVKLRRTLQQKRKVEPVHLKALPHAEVATAIAKIHAGEHLPTTKLAFEFLILTAARSAEVREATWSEIDLVYAIWTVPKNRMKNGREHNVPLARRSVEILEEASQYRDRWGFLFPGLIAGRPLSENTFSDLCKDKGIDGTAHGMRSSFRSWSAECTDYPSELAEYALSHVNANQVERAYQRSDLFEKRRELMESWADYLISSRHG